MTRPSRRRHRKLILNNPPQKGTQLNTSRDTVNTSKIRCILTEGAFRDVPPGLAESLDWQQKHSQTLRDETISKLEQMIEQNQKTLNASEMSESYEALWEGRKADAKAFESYVVQKMYVQEELDNFKNSDIRLKHAILTMKE